MSRIIRAVVENGRFVAHTQPLAVEFVKKLELPKQIMTLEDTLQAHNSNKNRNENSAQQAPLPPHFSGLVYRPFNNLTQLARRLESGGIGEALVPGAWSSHRTHYVVVSRLRIRPDQKHCKAKGYEISERHMYDQPILESPVRRRHKDTWRLHDPPPIEQMAAENLPKPTWLEADGVVEMGAEAKEVDATSAKRIRKAISKSRKILEPLRPNYNNMQMIELPHLAA